MQCLSLKQITICVYSVPCEVTKSIGKVLIGMAIGKPEKVKWKLYSWYQKMEGIC